MQNGIDLTNVLKGALKSRNNPTDLKAINIAKVVKLEPLTVSLYEGKVLLREDNELYISEWFRFRCNIDKEKTLSETVPSNLGSAKNCPLQFNYCVIGLFTLQYFYGKS